MKTYLNMLLAGIILLSTACSKDDDNTKTGGDGLPARVVIKAMPSAAGDGKVDFETTAINAVSYMYEFGDGTTQTSADGKAMHTYNLPGTNTYYVTVTAKNASGQALSKTTSVKVTKTTVATGLVWSDEFNTNGAPNGANWGYDIGTGSNGWGNGEAQYYTNRTENVVVQDGVLKITARKENYNGSAFTSARLLSKNKFEFKYGRVEARAKLAPGTGTWPAIWMLGADISNVGWPNAGEIDIMEFKGSQPNVITAALHFPGRFGGNPVMSSTSVTNATSTFHLYKLEWTPTTIKISVDDKTFLTFANNQSVPFNKNFFLLLNVAMGGSYGGAIDPTFSSSTMEVDYVRVYAL